MFLGLDNAGWNALFTACEPFFLWYFGILNIGTTLLIVLGAFKVYLRNRDLKEENFFPIMQSESLPEIAFILPSYNEGKTIVESVKSILRLTYRYKKIFVVNDGSQDNSVALLVKEFDMVPIPKLYEDLIPAEEVIQIYQSQKNKEVILVDKKHGGKFDTVNVGINAVQSDYFIVMDTDTFVENSGFEALIRPLLSDPRTISVGSSIRVKNGCTLEYNRINTKKFPREYLISLQAMEYMRSFLSRLGWDYCNGNFIIAGAFSLFPREVLVKVGGFSDSVGEDVEIIIRLHRLMKETKTPYRIFYVPDAIAWTVAQEKLKDLSKQRTRWHLAVLESLYFHRRMCGNPVYGRLGVLIYPFWFLGEALEPLIEIIGYLYIFVFWCLGGLHLPFLIFYFMLSMGLIFLYTFFSIVTEDLGFRKYPAITSIFLLFTSCVVENFGYHQLTLWWRMKAYYRFFRKLPQLKKESAKIKAKIAKAKNL